MSVIEREGEKRFDPEELEFWLPEVPDVEDTEESSQEENGARYEAQRQIHIGFKIDVSANLRANGEAQENTYRFLSTFMKIRSRRI